MIPPLKPSDYVAASMPTLGSITFSKVAALTLADWQSIAGIVGTVLGTAYLVWKWHREAKKSAAESTEE